MGSDHGWVGVGASGVDAKPPILGAARRLARVAHGAQQSAPPGMRSSHFIANASEQQGLVGNMNAQAVEASPVKALEYFYMGTASTRSLPTFHV